MPEPTTVWLVPLGRGGQQEVKGLLALHPDGLVFSPTGSAEPARLPLTEIKRVHRVHGSPVMIVQHHTEGAKLKTAFYFSQPPPMPPPRRGAPSLANAGARAPHQVADQDPGRPSPVLGLKRSGKRRTQRKNAGYLTTANVTKKEVIVTWVAEIEEARRSR
jgi:hypothetical protein